MNIYNPDDRALNVNESLLNSLKDEDMRGFFLKSELETLFKSCDNPNQNDPKKVGIRIYNLSSPDNCGSPSLIASAVKTNGFEFEDIYLHSREVNENLQNIPLSNFNDKQSAREATRFVKNKRKFLSFFSSKSLQDNLFDTDFEGLCFFEVRIGFASRPELLANNFKLTVSKNKKTHIAIPVNLVESRIPSVSLMESSFMASKNMMCLNPCPGHCVQVKNLNEQNVHLVEKPKFLVNDPYLFEW